MVKVSIIVAATIQVAVATTQVAAATTQVAVATTRVAAATTQVAAATTRVAVIMEVAIIMVVAVIMVNISNSEIYLPKTKKLGYFSYEYNIVYNVWAYSELIISVTTMSHKMKF